MDSNKIPRRERRHYRQYKENGDIVYSDLPTNSNSSKTYTSDYKLSSNSKKPVKSLLNINGKKSNTTGKTKKIQSVLENLSEIISPNIDAITDAIYNQVKNDDTLYDFKKKKIEQTIKNSKHYRATKENDVPVDYDGVKLLVEDVFVQLENEDIRNSVASAKEKKEAKVSISKKSKTIKKTKKKTKKSEMHALLTDDDDDELDDTNNEDDLGLKF